MRLLNAQPPFLAYQVQNTLEVGMFWFNFLSDLVQKVSISPFPGCASAKIFFVMSYHITTTLLE